MPLMKCPVCGEDISTNANFCPHCGEPFNNNDNRDVRGLIPPDFPIDMNLGKQIVNWTYDAAVTGSYNNSGDIRDKIPSGKIHVLLFQHGLKICGPFFTPYLELHNSQIHSISEMSGMELKNKSVIGRAVIGTVVFGEIGAIIGGLSGVGLKNKRVYYLVINYWSRDTKELFSITIECKESNRRFIERFNKQKS
ncbi:zinc ribbon domain-containing protein [Clostridium sp. MSJ-8]|uniref:zinc ribbon domain-containing protein n=1 Tax=Clostridium sp. MSJ-8 TaxID=2841510 RepID=UPI001C0F02C2|nr:zinc ribbon domain-containing protein [Clostridium sp. MSJ-8]MBU5486879.1 zinc ribbon domain-containing protein [Clostridium sp. MSJ-8]